MGHFVQEKVLDIIKTMTFGNTDGVDIVNDLESCEGLWVSCFPTNSAGVGRIVKELPSLYNADTLYILCGRFDVPAMKRITGSWQAQTTEVITDRVLAAFTGMTAAQAGNYALLRIWWGEGN